MKLVYLLFDEKLSGHPPQKIEFHHKTFNLMTFATTNVLFRTRNIYRTISCDTKIAKILHMTKRTRVKNLQVECDAEKDQERVLFAVYELE